MDKEEKELTTEEMKTLISLTTILPAILEKINKINAEFLTLKTSFQDVQKRLVDHSNVINAYVKEVNDSSKRQVTIDDLKKELKTIKESIVRIEASLVTREQKPELKKEQPKPTKKPETMDKVEIIIDRIINECRGNKRVLTIKDLKDGFKADEETANKVLKRFEELKMYDPKTNILTVRKK